MATQIWEHLIVMFVLKHTKPLKGKERCLSEKGGKKLSDSERDGDCQEGSSWCDKMIGHIVVSSYSKSTCCSINCNLTTTISNRSYMSERGEFFFPMEERQTRKHLLQERLTDHHWAEATYVISLTPPVHVNESVMCILT